MSIGGDVFKDIFYYISPSISCLSLEHYETMISLLNSGKGTEMKTVTKDTTHIICDTSEYERIKELFTPEGFCCCVIPKWVFISQSLNYCLPTVDFVFMIHS